MIRSRPENKPTHQAHLEIILLLTAFCLLALYTLLRYGALWGENDTAFFTKAIRSMSDAGKLVPDLDIYTNGYGFSALAVFLVQICGISASDFQLYGAALLAIWLVIPAWLLYREFTGSNRAATLAAVILFVQPEFLFPIFRGTHEKFTRGLILLCLYLLLRSLRSRDRLARSIGLIVAFYVAAYAMITFNSLIAGSFILAVGLSMALAWLIMRSKRIASQIAKPAVERLIYVVISLMTIAFIFIFYAYPPAENQIRLMQNVADRMAALFLPVESMAINPYAVVATGWISLPVYFLVSLADWILLVASLVIWINQTGNWWRGRQPPQEQREVLLWSFYGAFAIIGAVTVVIDISGSLSSNLQHRIFPSFAMIAAPLVAGWLVNWKPKRAWISRIATGGMITILSLLAVLSTFKATNEPLLSNKWMFYLPAEIRAIDWANDTLAGHSLWTEYDERLSSAYTILNSGGSSSVILDAYKANTSTRDLLISEVTLARSQRLIQPLPITYDSLLTYDNGQAQIYHLRPKTPYQH